MTSRIIHRATRIAFRLGMKVATLVGLFILFTGMTFAAEDISLLPKYGNVPKTQEQKALDSQFIAEVDAQYKGDRKKAAGDLADRGWKYLREGRSTDAIRRFNQAWLLDDRSGKALWGMAAYASAAGKDALSLTLFSEAEPLMREDIDFAVDHARALGFAGANNSDQGLLKDAFSRYERIYQRAPQHTLNLQNWAITLFYVGDYENARRKIELAKTTPQASQLDPAFLKALADKKPHP